VARKDSSEGIPRRGSDIAGIIQFSLGLLLLVALFSYDRHDLLRLPPRRDAAASPQFHRPLRRPYWRPALLCFWRLGVSPAGVPARVRALPLHRLDAYLRRRWPWALVLLLTVAAALDLGMDRSVHEKLTRHQPVVESGFLEQLTLNLNAPSAGGVVGLA